jgi:hypothetical protein
VCLPCACVCARARSSFAQILAVCASLGASVDAEEERLVSRDLDYSDVTMAAISALTVDALATYVPPK